MPPSFLQNNCTNVEAIARVCHNVLEVEATKKNMSSGLSPFNQSLYKNTTDTVQIEDLYVWLTWKDLIASVTNAKGETHRFLQGSKGYAEDDYIMGIMVPSGFGKSTLLADCSVKF
jgi:hypothetical protein